MLSYTAKLSVHVRKAMCKPYSMAHVNMLYHLFMHTLCSHTQCCTTGNFDERKVDFVSIDKLNVDENHEINLFGPPYWNIHDTTHTYIHT